MRRVPPALWITAPLLLAGLYALAHGLLAPTPTAADVVPEEAVLSHRFRDLSTVGRAFPWPLGTIFFPEPMGENAPVVETIARLRNLPGLPGVDRDAPFHWVLLPREGRPDPTMAVFPVEDAEALRDLFEDPDDLFDRGFVRHAQNLEVRGRFAGVAWDRDAVRRLGTGGVTSPDLGEDHVISVRVPETLEFALLAPVEEPWRSLLEALGYEGDRPQVLTDPRTGRPLPGLAVGAGRVWRVHQAWTTLRLWSWLREGRVRLDLEPTEKGPRALLEVPAGEGTGGPLPAVPPRARAWLRVPDHAALHAVVAVLRDVGVDLPPEVLSPAGWLGAVAGGPVLAWAEQAESPHAWTVGAAAPRGRLPDLSAFFPGYPAGPGALPLAEGAVPLLAYDRRARKPSPAGRLVRTERGPFDVVALGPDAEAVAASVEGAPAAWTPPAPPEPGLRLLAAFFLDEPRATKVLGALAGTRGFLSALAGGDLSGEVWTDGKTVRVEARVARAP